jgi:hypothetical protein
MTLDANSDTDFAHAAAIGFLWFCISPTLLGPEKGEVQCLGEMPCETGRLRSARQRKT